MKTGLMMIFAAVLCLHVVNPKPQPKPQPGPGDPVCYPFPEPEPCPTWSPNLK